MQMDTEHWNIRKPSTTHTDGMVTAQNAWAARAGAAILAEGGNAVDAAVATALALCVVEPWMSGLGGSGLMTVWRPEIQRAEAINFQGMLPGLIDIRDYPLDPNQPQSLMGFPGVEENTNVEGYRSITVPGSAAGLDMAISNWGRLKMNQVAAPAIRLAENGFQASWFTTLQTSLASASLAQDPVSAAIYLPGGHPIQPETQLEIPNLAKTLRLFARDGALAFYQGELAELIVEDLQSGGSEITLDDLASYEPTLTSIDPFEHRGCLIHALGDDSGGTRLRDFLNHSAAHIPDGTDGPSAETWCVYADGLNNAFAEHNRRIGRNTEVGSCTSHLSVVDRDGMMVSLTHTLLNRFGSGVTLPQTGLLMNNAVSYFDPRPGFPTSIMPRKRINASNMCPVLATRDGQAQLAIGASGGNQIMPAVAQVIALMLDFQMSLEDAMESARLDGSDRGWIAADPRLGDDVLQALGSKYEVQPHQRLVFPKHFACVSAVARSGACWKGLSDPSLPTGASFGPRPLDLNASRDDGPAPVRA